MPKLCLNMIVKNESAIIEKCLAAAAPHIDCYCICDTGSTDDTPEKIERFFQSRGIPGIVPRTTFRTFEQARNEALDAARSSLLEFDYLLFADADFELVVERPDFKDAINEAAHSLLIKHVSGTLEYPLLRIARRDTPLRFVGVTHEYPDVGATPRPLIPGAWFRDNATGSSRVEKYERDIRLLSQALAANPRDARSAFYLANSYFDIGRYQDALAAYRKRLDLGGWAEEVFFSMYRVGQCYQGLNREPEMYRQLLATFDAFPHRAEPLHTLALHEQRAARHRSAYLFARQGSEIPKPAEGLFVQADVYTWRLRDIMAVSLYYMGNREGSLRLNESILPLVPPGELERIRKNIRWCLGAAAG
ncbi:MAG: glycosyltransferase [Phycisphaerales bacterium]|nr:glycosyltransferase [Phycisphaerales bacterium]